ncbi:MAG: HAMP domain-containing histidine kinase [Bacteroidales bacterium]|nr:HAMP domain-containing histidine kinase [Bacteroidales bacterium]MBQ3832661.1 HAMP domain-containing histidine kinase [Bacteroidales bacterium]MBQ4474608.1 HAMP domain-containing histidine kinase [Bacteroidales bacterium]
MKDKNYRYDKKWKIILLSFAALIFVLSLIYTNKLMKDLRQEEYRRMELWSHAMGEFINSDPETDIGFLFEVLENNQTIPVILVDADNETIISYRNLDTIKMENAEYAADKLEEFRNNGKESFSIIGPDGEVMNTIYYSDSLLLKKLQYYPYIQLILIAIFIIMGYIVLNVSRRSEQNHVWLGMSKETAHQLGTPISSLMAWLEIMRDEHGETEMFREVEKDVKRLEKIAARFSKIGSKPNLHENELVGCIRNTMSYLKTRIPATIHLETNITDTDEIYLPLNVELFEWVIENLCKNAVDAIGTNGTIRITIESDDKNVGIEISDTGKGISKSDFKNVFKPGYTTKNRGWGLGLSLAKRIVEEYHGGKIFVKSSEIGKGTTFRINLKKIQ